MGIEVIGAGFGRTGTLSLKFALEALGFDRCYHMMEVPLNPKHSVLWSDAAAGRQVDWPALYQGYKATVGSLLEPVRANDFEALNCSCFLSAVASSDTKSTENSAKKLPRAA